MLLVIIYGGAFGLLLLLWLAGRDRWNSWLARKFVRERFKNPRMGMLTTDEVKTEGRSEAFTPSDWQQSFQTTKTPVQFVGIGPKAHVESFGVDVVVNPLEEHYAETDLANQARLKELTDFVRRGGVIVATGGLPFFWILDSAQLSRGKRGFTGAFLSMYREIASAPKVLVQGHDPRLASLLDTWLSKAFGVTTTLGDSREVKLRIVDDEYFRDLLPKDNDVTVSEFRAPVRCDSREAKLIPVVKADWRFGPSLEYTLECYPIAGVRYGIGYLVIFALRLGKENKELVFNVMQRILRKLKEKGRLD